MKAVTSSSGVNRAQIWQIGLFALNNTSSNVYLFVLGMVSYYTFGPAGLALAVILNIIMAMRLFDGITDPIIGNIMDRTMTKFGKFRPFIAIGQIIMFISIVPMYLLVYKIDNTALAYLVFILLYAIYIIGYTCQTAVTKAGQVALTSDPKQRPIFSLFDSIYNVLLFTLAGMYIITLATNNGGFNKPGFFQDVIITFIPLSILFAILGIIGIWQKDNEKYIIKNQKRVKIRDLLPILRKNRALQMLVVAASTDKLASSIAGNTIIATALLYYAILGNPKLAQQIALPTSLISVGVVFLGVAVARKLGLKKALVSFSWIAIIGMLIFMVTFLVINPQGASTKISSSTGIIFVFVYIISRIGMSVSGGIVIPMIADCSDYETYTSGKVVPGSIGTLFSFVDKLVSSLATSIISVLIVIFGFKEINNETTYSDSALWIFLIAYCIIPILGWVASLIAMKFYPLTREKMQEIQTELAKVRAKDNK